MIFQQLFGGRRGREDFWSEDDWGLMPSSRAVSTLQAGLTGLYLPGLAQCLTLVGVPQILKMHFLTLFLF